MSTPETRPAADPGRALAVAYAYLNRRERTVAEVRARLERADVGAAEAEAVIAELLEFGYLDDTRYARLFTQDKRTLEQWGQVRIARVLRERGVDRETIAQALAETSESPPDPAGADDAAWVPAAADAAETELGRALSLLCARFPRGPVLPRDRERAFAMLLRKGYESEPAADAVRAWARGER